jgi:hypothetical protein
MGQASRPARDPRMDPDRRSGRSSSASSSSRRRRVRASPPPWRSPSAWGRWPARRSERSSPSCQLGGSHCGAARARREPAGRPSDQRDHARPRASLHIPGVLPGVRPLGGAAARVTVTCAPGGHSAELPDHCAAAHGPRARDLRRAARASRQRERRHRRRDATVPAGSSSLLAPNDRYRFAHARRSAASPSSRARIARPAGVSGARSSASASPGRSERGTPPPPGDRGSSLAGEGGAPCALLLPGRSGHAPPLTAGGDARERVRHGHGRLWR